MMQYFADDLGRLWSVECDDPTRARIIAVAAAFAEHSPFEHVALLTWATVEPQALARGIDFEDFMQGYSLDVHERCAEAFNRAGQLGFDPTPSTETIA